MNRTIISYKRPKKVSRKDNNKNNEKELLTNLQSGNQSKEDKQNIYNRLEVLHLLSYSI